MTPHAPLSPLGSRRALRLPRAWRESHPAAKQTQRDLALLSARIGPRHGVRLIDSPASASAVALSLHKTGAPRRLMLAAGPRFSDPLMSMRAFPDHVAIAEDARAERVVGSRPAQDG